MKYVFKSRAGADVLMLTPYADELLSVMAKAPGQQGIITLEQLPAAIAALAALHEPAGGDHSGDDEAGDDHGTGLARRAVPLLGLLRESLAAQLPVTWEASARALA